jgi:uncharacterized damage-inducible protein DinB
MTTTPSPFDILIKGWQVYHDSLTDTIRPLTDAQLALTVSDQLRTAGSIITHIVEARAGWFTYDLKEHNDEIAAMAEWREPRSSSELVHGLTATWQFMQEALARWTPDELVAPLILEGFEQHPVSRAWVLWHLMEHDLHHGGELAFVLGSHSIAVRIPPGPPEEN